MFEDLAEITAITYHPEEGQNHSSEYQTGKQYYTLYDRVGEGSTGTIHLAQEHYLNRKVAFKQLKKQGAEKREENRFQNEAWVTAQLDHPNIVPVYSLEATQNGLAYAMKWVEGHTLKDYLQAIREQYDTHKPLLDSQSLFMRLCHFLDVCDAVSYAHSKGLLHRRLEPSNIMIGPFHDTYVMDWSVACPIKGKEHMSQELELFLEDETDLISCYMSPEQAQGWNEKLDERSDLFSLGSILFEMITLKPAFVGKSIKIPLELKAIIRKATALKPTDRYESVNIMANDIRHYMRGETVSARPENGLEACLRWINHYRKNILITVFMVIFLSACFTTWNLFRRQVILKQASQREPILQAFLTDVFEQSQKMDTQFLEMEVLLEGLASVATHLLTRGQPVQEPYYTSTRFFPPDLKYSHYYQGMASIEWPFWILAYNVKEADILSRMRQLMPLRHYYKRLMLRSHTQGSPVKDLKQQRTLITEEKGPIMWAGVIMNEGAAYWYPGTGIPIANFDPRTRPYHRLAAHKYGRHWGNPYIDNTASGLVLSCATSLYDPANRFMGTVNLHVTFAYIIKHLMAPHNQKAITQTYLLDEEGYIVLRSAQEKQTFSRRKQIYPALKSIRFPNPSVVESIKAKESGYIETHSGQRHQLMAYYRLNTLGWYYLVVANTEHLF